MDTINILLGIIGILLFGIFVRLGTISYNIRSNLDVSSAYNNDHFRQKQDASKKQEIFFDEALKEIEGIKLVMENIEEVADIFYKYKLPNAEERKLFDEIEIDNEVYDRISGD
jgi:hypothetical protein